MIKKFKPFAILILFVFLSDFSYSQDSDSLKIYYSGEIIITAQNESIIKTASTIDIDKTKINSKDNFSLNESFSQIPGLTITQNSRNESIIKLRGFEQRQTAVFFDGVPLYISYDGTYDLSQINSAPIGKITISKSMSSVLYGANTLGGSVNIITDEPVKKIETFAKLMFGNSYGAFAKNSGMYKTFHWLISANYNKSDGYNLPSSFSPTKNENGDKRNNTSFIQKGATVKLGFKPADNSDFTLAFSKTLNSKDVPTQIYTNFPRYWKYTDWNNTIINFISNFKINDALKLRGNIYTVNSYNVLNAYDNNSYTTQIKNSSFTSTYDEYSTGISIIPEINISKIFSGRFAFFYKHDTHYDRANYNKPNKKFSAETYTAGLEKNFKISEIDFITALNFNILNITFANDSTTRNEIPALNGHFGIGKNITSDIYIYAHVSNKSRFPTLKELFSEQLGKSIPNPDLAEERSWNTETGIKLKNSKIGNINLALFYSDVRNMIVAVPINTSVFQYQNIGKVTLGGIEINYQKSFSFVDADVNYTYLNSKNKSDLTTDKLEYRPEHIFNLTLSKSYEFGLLWQFETSFTGKRYGIDSDSQLWRNLPDYTVLNIRISQNIFNKFTAFARVNNLLDKYYETEYGFPQAGRNFVIGVETNF
ncbi:MAG: TonB-dependent receptor [Ignavibacteria bacterium]